MITYEHFLMVIKLKRTKSKMQRAVKLVLMGGISYAEAGRMTGVSRQAVYKAVKSFKKTCEDLAVKI